jgi:hypothetical protein
MPSCGRLYYDLEFRDKNGDVFDPPPIFYYLKDTSVLALKSSDKSDAYLSPYTVKVIGY